MRSALHFGSGMLGSYAGIFSEMWTQNIKGQIQKPEIPGMLKVAEMRRADGALPVGPALAFLAKNKEENLLSLSLEYLILQLGCCKYYKYVSDVSKHRSSEPPQRGVYLEKHLPQSDHHHCMLSGTAGDSC